MEKKALFAVAGIVVVLSLAIAMAVGENKVNVEHNLIAAPEQVSRRIFVESKTSWSGVSIYDFETSKAEPMTYVCDTSYGKLYYKDIDKDSFSHGRLFVNTGDVSGTTPNWSAPSNQSEDADALPAWGSTDAYVVTANGGSKASVGIYTIGMSESSLASLLSRYTSCAADATRHTDSCLAYPQLFADFGLGSFLSSNAVVPSYDGGEKNGTTLGQKIVMMRDQYQLFTSMEESSTMTIYCPKEYDHVWAWNDEGRVVAHEWPGEEMNTSDPTWNTYTFHNHFSLNIVLNDNNGHQTADYVLVGSGAHYYYEGNWYTENPLRIRVFAQKEWLNIYAWDNNDSPIIGSYPGSALSDYDEDWKVYDFGDRSYVNFLLNKGEGQAKTGDLRIDNYGDYYVYDGLLFDENPLGGQVRTTSLRILHCFDWKLTDITANLAKIKAAGFDAVQTSPLQVPKDYWGADVAHGDIWWKMYQPVSFSIAPSNHTYIGGATELIALTSKASALGMGVIVDVVANHLGKQNEDRWTLDDEVPTYEPELYEDKSNTFRFNGMEASDESVEKVVRGNIGFPDLNTGNTKVQNRVLAYLKSLINCGVTGFRFDAAKHIETSQDGYFASDFWENTLGAAETYAGRNLFAYGEILGPGPYRSYGSYIHDHFDAVSDATTGEYFTLNIHNNTSYGSGSYNTGLGAENNILWAESHDNYLGSAYPQTGSFPQSDIDASYAMLCSKNAANVLYFARPGSDLNNINASSWRSSVVSKVNRFHKVFAGGSEYASATGNASVMERKIDGRQGVVIANAGESTQYNIAMHLIGDGTYKDLISGNTYTVSSSKVNVAANTVVALVSI